MDTRLEYASLAEYCDAVQRDAHKIYYYNGSPARIWFNDETYESALTKAVHGDDSIASEAQKLLTKMDDGIETHTRQWEPSVYGAYPIVPAYLAGMPECMARLDHVESDSAPLNIWVHLGCHGNITAQQMLNRGVALVALLLKLQAIRPVTLKIMHLGVGTEGRNLIQVIDIESKPIELATACYVLSNVGFTRRVVYNQAAGKVEYDGQPYRPEDHGLNERTVIGASPEDLIIKRAWTGDPLLADPVKWVNEQLVAKYTTGEGR